MNDLRDRLNDADPVARDGALGEQEAQGMRRTVVAAVDEQASSPARWGMTSWATATLLVAVTIAIGVSRWFGPQADQAPSRTVEPVSGSISEPPRQVQFVAPGGTRIIWIFNAEFKP